MLLSVMILLIVNSVCVLSQTCPEDTFKGSLNGTICSNFVKRKDFLSAEKCRLACCLNSTCGGWLWCPDTGSGVGCNGWGSARCHLGIPNEKDCKPATHWIGETKSQQTPTPAPHVPTPGPVPPHPPATKKQGFSGFLGRPPKTYSCDDAKALNLEDAWYYNWIHSSSQGTTCQGKTTAFEFAPMVIGIGSASQVTDDIIRTDWAPHNVHYLLGYNEPDPGNHPHMVDPAKAAQDWPNVQALAAKLDPPLILVSPAPSTKGIDDTGKSEWLDQFFGNCTEVPDCNASLIKYVAFHDYVGNASALVARAEGAYQRYGRKVWITEFAINKWACHCEPTRIMQDEYMKEVIPALEKSDAVFRYAWYTARDQPMPANGGGNLLMWNVTKPTPTSTGQIYANFAKERRK